MTWTPRQIIALRDRHGWTQQDLADRIDVSRRAVQGWESGDLDRPSKLSRSNAAALDRVAESSLPPIPVADLVANIHRIPVKALFTESVRRLMNGIPDTSSSGEPIPLSEDVEKLGDLDFDPGYAAEAGGDTESDVTAT